MFCSLVRRVSPHGVFRLVSLAVALFAIALSTAGVMSAQGNKSQSAQAGLSNLQRMDIMRSKLDAMRRTLDGAIAAVNAKDTGNKEKNADDPRTRFAAWIRKLVRC